MTTKIRKGCFVTLDEAKCFTVDNGGERRHMLTSIDNDRKGIVPAYRPITDEEVDAWYQSDDAKGMTSAGETKLPPRAVRVDLHRGKTYEVLRARARAALGWGNPVPGLVKIRIPETGEEVYVKRDLVRCA